MRLTGVDYSSPGAYFVTVCTRERRLLFGAIAENRMCLSPLGHEVQACLLGIPTHHPGVAVDRFVVMPNHIHTIVVLGCRGDIDVAPTRPRGLPEIVGTFKAAVSRRTGRVGIWQRGYYDRVIRCERELEAIREYIANNPLRWALDCENPDRSPLRG
jgi:REP element-mobilizing transposase RayT